LKPNEVTTKNARCFLTSPLAWSITAIRALDGAAERIDVITCADLAPSAHIRLPRRVSDQKQGVTILCRSLRSASSRSCRRLRLMMHSREQRTQYRAAASVGRWLAESEARNSRRQDKGTVRATWNLPNEQFVKELRQGLPRDGNPLAFCFPAVHIGMRYALSAASTRSPKGYLLGSVEDRTERRHRKAAQRFGASKEYDD